MICPNCGYAIKPKWAFSVVKDNEHEYTTLNFYCRCGFKRIEIHLDLETGLKFLNGGGVEVVREAIQNGKGRIVKKV